MEDLHDNMNSLGFNANNEHDLELVPKTIMPDSDIDILSLDLSPNNQTDVEVETDLSSNNNDEMEPERNPILCADNEGDTVVLPKPQKCTKGIITRSSSENGEPPKDVELEPSKGNRGALGGAKRKSARLETKVTSKDETSAKNVKVAEAAGRIWKEYEMDQSLNGLEAHGSKNWKKAAACVPIKNDSMVKANINMEKINQTFTTQKDDGANAVSDDDAGPMSIRKPLKSLTNIKKKNDGPSLNPEEILVRRKRSAPIEKWLEIAEKRDEEVSGVNCSQILPISLNWIADNELHPDPGDCGGIDYALIYRYLACLCQGEAPPNLDPATAARVADFLPMLMGIVNKMDMGKEGEWLENYRETGSASGYVREERFDGNSEAVKNMEMLSKIPGLNPLGIDAEVCVERLIPMPLL